LTYGDVVGIEIEIFAVAFNKMQNAASFRLMLLIEKLSLDDLETVIKFLYIFKLLIDGNESTPYQYMIESNFCTN